MLLRNSFDFANLGHLTSPFQDGVFWKEVACE